MHENILSPEALQKALLPYWEKWAPDTTFIFNTDEDKGMGNYDYDEKSITVRYLSLLSHYAILKEQKLDISFFQFALLTLAHEAGHHLDKHFVPTPKKNGKFLYNAYKLPRTPENKPLYENYILSYCKGEFFKEIRAWKIARKLLANNVPKEGFYIVCRYCLDSYRKRYKKNYEFEMNRFYAS